MLALDKIVAGAKLRGIAGPSVVEVVRVEWIGSDALNVVYRGSDGPAEVPLSREAEPGCSWCSQLRPNMVHLSCST
jgi:hypothetical protein